MSQGSHKIVVRLPEELLELVSDSIIRANGSRKTERYKLSSWIRAAICEKLNHGRRSMREIEERVRVTTDELNKLKLLDE